jgi:hypothetical protein
MSIQKTSLDFLSRGTSWNEVQNHADNQRAKKQRRYLVIPGHRGFRSVQLGASKLGQSKSSQVGGDSGVGSGRLSGTQYPAISNSHSLDIFGMNLSSVIATWCGRSPSVDLSSSRDDRHGISSFDRFDILPTNPESLQRVDDGYRLGGKDYFRPENYQVDGKSRHATPASSFKDRFERSAREAADKASKNQKPKDTNSENAGFRSKGFVLSHAGMFAHPSPFSTPRVKGVHLHV